MAQTKADRQAAAKKAAATRQRNAERAQSEAVGKKAASTRQARAAKDNADEAWNALVSIAGSVTDGLTSAVKAAGTAAKEGGKAVATRVGATKIDKR